MEEKDLLYLVGKEEEGVLLVPAETLVALFMLQYCHNPAIDVVLVNTCKQECAVTKNVDGISLEKGDEIWFPVDAKGILFPFVVKELAECPAVVSNCVLPVIVMTSEPWCVAGLTSCLRVVLIKTDKKYPGHYCKKLLGFRGGCMQACAEVSIWTKFCEIEVVNTLKDIHMNCHVNQGKVVHIPKDIIRYEHHFTFPPILHNALKMKQQHIKDTVTDKTERQKLLAKKLCDLPDMEHEYAEGLNMTMADVMLFACFHIIICKIKHFVILDDICPLLMKWYNLLLKDEYIGHSLCLLHKTFEDVPLHSEKQFEVIIPEVQRESLYNSDPERYKPRWRAFTHQEDIDRVLELLTVSSTDPEYDNHPNGEDITLSWKDYPSAVSPQEGQLPPSRLERKCQQLDNMISAVLSLVSEGDVIVDFCAGGGHVGIILAYLLPTCKVLFVENKDDSLRLGMQRINSLKLKNVEYLQCNLDYFQGKFDIGVCLHACGVATDLVMQKCFDQRAKFVCCPCCYGSVRPNHVLDYPRSQEYSDVPITLDDYLILGHTSDQTHDEHNPKTEQGQLCMRLIDNDRLLLARGLGYSTRMVLMQPKTCTPKNHLLIGVLEN